MNAPLWPPIRLVLTFLYLLALAMGEPVRIAAADAPAAPIRVLLITGGHDYETNQFLATFRANPDLVVETAVHPEAHAWFKADRASRYDVMVFYDMWAEISDAARSDLVARLQEGKGLVALHHCLASYPKWSEYTRILGGKYLLQKEAIGGAERPASTYLHDVQVAVRIADPAHPVTRGLRDFVIHDETYGGFYVDPSVKVLLTTDTPTSGPNLAWGHDFGKARVVYIQLGHDHQAYENPNYRQLLRQAIAWTARRDH
jgi:type 1 glutamine amidotransferase